MSLQSFVEGRTSRGKPSAFYVKQPRNGLAKLIKLDQRKHTELM